MRAFILILVGACLGGCSVFGANGVESAPYTVVQADKEKEIEVRHYDPMVLVSASMDDEGENSAFRKLFRYISGYNRGDKAIAMTAPVFMNDNAEGKEIAMTSPVFMAENAESPSMSFVMPRDFTVGTTPEPIDDTLTVSELKNFRAVAIKFNGTLSDSNVEEHTAKLVAWLENTDYTVAGAPITAGYDGPMTLPFLRHNEVLIPID